MKEVKLPSGRKLQVTLAPFSDSKALYQAFLEEGKGLRVSMDQDVAAMYKDLACLIGSSQLIEQKLWECIGRCLIDKERISDETFEKKEHRKDYLPVMVEVCKENILPFLEDLSAEYATILELLKKEAGLA